MTLMLTRWLPIACALLPLAALGAPPAAIKLTSELTTLLDISVEINGVKGWLTVDSGAMSTVLDKNLAQDLKVSLKRGQGKSEGVGGRSNNELGEITVRVPGRQPKDFPTLSGKHKFATMGQETTATSLGRNLGVIGLSELIAAGAIIDCTGSRLILHPEGEFHCPQKGLELTMLRYAANSKTFFKLSRVLKSIDELKIKEGFLWAIPVKIANNAGVMIVDTGCERTVVSQDFAELVGIESVTDGASALGIGGTGASSQGIASCALPDLLLNGKLQLGKIQGICLKQSLFSKLKDVAGGDLPVIGIIGFDQLNRIKAFVDCKRGVIHTTDEPLKPDRPISSAVEGPKAVDALAKAGDKEAIEMIKTLEGDCTKLTFKQAKEFIDRAVQKGLLKEDEKPAP
jgi:Aspartyl protease